MLGLELVLGIVTLLLIRIVKPVSALVIGTFFLFLYSYFLLEVVILPHYLVALSVTALWYFFLRKVYRYNRTEIRIFGITLYPVLAWSLSLPSLLILIRLISRAADLDRVYLFPLWYGLFVIFLITFEWIGYHLLNVRLKSGYKGLFFLDCMHIPGWAKLGYFSLGAVYFFVLDFFDLLLIY